MLNSCSSCGFLANPCAIWYANIPDRGYHYFHTTTTILILSRCSVNFHLPADLITPICADYFKLAAGVYLSGTAIPTFHHRLRMVWRERWMVSTEFKKSPSLFFS
jgi:hypothetical protein